MAAGKVLTAGGFLFLTRRPERLFYNSPTAMLQAVYTSFLLTVSTVLGLQWSSTLWDGIIVDTCVGDSVYLPWSYTLERSEVAMDVEWYFERPGQPEEVFASYISGRLLTPRQDVVHVPNAGLLIHQVTAAEAGNYTVHINVRDSAGYVSTNTHSADVVVAVAPTTSDDRLHLQLRPGATVDQRSGQWSVELECGHFTSLGQPPVTVTWTDPAGTSHTSSHYANGTFVFTIADPITSGNYSCQLSLDTPGAKCIIADSPLKEVTSLYIDGKDVKVTVLEARQRELLNQVDNLKTNNSRLRQTIENLTNQRQVCEGKNLEYEIRIHNLTNQTDTCSAQNRLLEVQVHQLRNQTQICEAEKTTLELQVQDLINQTSNQCRHPETCVDVRQYDSTSGVHTLYPRGHSPIAVYCDQTTDGGGWTVFQRRMDGSVDFYRNWTEYQRGFGDLDHEFWLGLDNLHTLTSAGRQKLRVDLGDWDGTRVYAAYSGFVIADSNDNYRLHFDNFAAGNAGDSLAHGFQRNHNGQQFSTFDVDHDGYGEGSCAIHFHGAWWYDNCHASNLNAEYKHISSAPGQDGLNWQSYKSTTYSMKFTEMKFRPM